MIKKNRAGAIRIGHAKLLRSYSDYFLDRAPHEYTISSTPYKRENEICAQEP